MAATAAAVASSFSTSMQSLKCISSRSWPNDQLVKISCPRTVLQPVSVSHFLGIQEWNPISKWKVYRLTAAVEQEEAALNAPVDEAMPEVGKEQPPVAEELPPSDQVAEEESGGSSTKLYFGNLPYNCDSAQLAGIIQQFASPELVEVLYSRDTGKSRGYAFVTMSTIEDCNTVIQNLDKIEHGGRTLRVNFADKPRPREALYPETEHKLFVGNLSWSVTSQMLKEAFQECGNVVGARVLYDGETGQSRGYGFVSYETRAEMETALEATNGMEIEGRAIRVAEAQKKKE